MSISISVSANRAQVAMEEMSAMLDAFSFTPNSLATVQCEDGSVFSVDSAFIREWKDPQDESEWIFMFCEHYSPMCFDKDDLNFWASYDRLDSTA